MLCIDLFGGAGGAALGLERLGFTPWSYEREADCLATLEAAGHRAVKLDLSSYEWDEAWTGQVSVLHGSPPCQPWSASGKNHGAADPRDGMPWMLAAIAALRPMLVTVENVAGLTYAKHKPYLEWFVEGIAELGYTVEWRVLNCADYGVPQTRKRLIVVGRLQGEVCWPAPTHTKDPAGDSELEQWVSMAAALGWGMDSPTRTVCGDRGPRWAYGAGANSYDTGRTLVGFPRRDDGNEAIVLDGERYRARDLFDAAGPAQTVTAKGRSWKRWTLNTGQDWKKGEDRSTAQQRSLELPTPTVTSQSSAWWIQPSEVVLQPGSWADGREGNRREYTTDEPAPTVALGNDGAAWVWRRPATSVNADPRISPPGHHDGNVSGSQQKDAIRLSVDELARLQDFPHAYPFQGTKTSKVRQIGNALPPTLLEAVVGANMWPPRWPVQI